MYKLTSLKPDGQNIYNLSNDILKSLFLVLPEKMNNRSYVVQAYSHNAYNITLLSTNKEKGLIRYQIKGKAMVEDTIDKVVKRYVYVYYGPQVIDLLVLKDYFNERRLLTLESDSFTDKIAEKYIALSIPQFIMDYYRSLQYSDKQIILEILKIFSNFISYEITNCKEMYNRMYAIREYYFRELFYEYCRLPEKISQLLNYMIMDDIAGHYKKQFDGNNDKFIYGKCILSDKPIDLINLVMKASIQYMKTRSKEGFRKLYSIVCNNIHHFGLLTALSMNTLEAFINNIDLANYLKNPDNNDYMYQLAGISKCEGMSIGQWAEDLDMPATQLSGVYFSTLPTFKDGIMETPLEPNAIPPVIDSPNTVIDNTTTDNNSTVDINHSIVDTNTPDLDTLSGIHKLNFRRYIDRLNTYKSVEVFENEDDKNSMINKLRQLLEDIADDKNNMNLSLGLTYAPDINIGIYDVLISRVQDQIDYVSNTTYYGTDDKIAELNQKAYMNAESVNNIYFRKKSKGEGIDFSNAAKIKKCINDLIKFKILTKDDERVIEKATKKNAKRSAIAQLFDITDKVANRLGQLIRVKGEAAENEITERVSYDRVESCLTFVNIFRPFTDLYLWIQNLEYHFWRYTNRSSYINPIRLLAFFGLGVRIFFKIVKKMFIGGLIYTVPSIVLDSSKDRLFGYSKYDSYGIFQRERTEYYSGGEYYHKLKKFSDMYGDIIEGYKDDEEICRLAQRMKVLYDRNLRYYDMEKDKFIQELKNDRW